jgi:WD40 repeat protein
MNAKPKRRWYQFSLRTYFVLVTINMSIRCTNCCAIFLLMVVGVLIESTEAQVVNNVDRPSTEGVGRLDSREFRTLGWCSTATLSPDGKTLAVAGYRTVTLTELESGKTTGQCAESEALLLSFLDNGKTLVSVSPEGTVRYWSVEKGIETRRAWRAFVPDGSFYPAAVLSRNGDLLLAPSEGKFVVWDLNQQRRLRECPIMKYSHSCALAPDGSVIATYDDLVDGLSDSLGRLVLLDAATGKQTATTNKFKGYCRGISFSPDGKMLVTCGGYDKYRVWDAKSLDEKCAFDRHDRDQYQMTFSPDSKWLATAHEDGFLRVWDLESKKEIRKFKTRVKGLGSPVQSVLFLKDQKRIVTVNHEVVRIWEVVTGQ